MLLLLLLLPLNDLDEPKTEPGIPLAFSHGEVRVHTRV